MLCKKLIGHWVCLNGHHCGVIRMAEFDPLSNSHTIEILVDSWRNEICQMVNGTGVMDALVPHILSHGLCLTVLYICLWREISLPIIININDGCQFVQIILTGGLVAKWLEHWSIFSQSGGHGFHPWLCHTKGVENDTGCFLARCSALRG